MTQPELVNRGPGSVFILRRDGSEAEVSVGCIYHLAPGDMVYTKSDKGQETRAAHVVVAETN